MKKIRLPKFKKPTPYDELCAILWQRAGEHGKDETPEDVLVRIIGERDDAFKILALDRIREFQKGRNTYWMPCRTTRSPQI